LLAPAGDRERYTGTTETSTACAITRDCLENTRTTMILSLVRLFAWNMPYHAEHHAYRAVPFHAPPRLHERVRGKIENLEPGYVTPSVKVTRYLFGLKADAR
jgi:fatty acid desaturase